MDTTEARLQIEHQLNELRLQLAELQDGTAYQARRAMRAADLAVASHPYRTAGLAAAAGLLLGLLIARR